AELDRKCGANCGKGAAFSGTRTAGQNTCTNEQLRPISCLLDSSVIQPIEYSRRRLAARPRGLERGVSRVFRASGAASRFRTGGATHLEIFTGIARNTPPPVGPAWWANACQGRTASCRARRRLLETLRTSS